MLVIDRNDARAQGLTRFFTGTACASGHVSERYVSNGSCIECLRPNASVQRYPIAFPRGTPILVRDHVLNVLLPERMAGLVAEAAEAVRGMADANLADALEATLRRNALKLRRKLISKGQLSLRTTAKAGKTTTSEFYEKGWTAELLVEHGYAEWVETPGG